jgi:hypothetical protein
MSTLELAVVAKSRNHLSLMLMMLAMVMTPAR